MAENAQVRGEEVRAALSRLGSSLPVGTVKDIRGRGLLNAIEFKSNMIDEKGRPLSAYDICIELKDAQKRHGTNMGLLCKQTHHNTIRLAPPLIIDEGSLRQGLSVLMEVIHDYR